MGLDVKAQPMNSDEIDGGITPSEFRRQFKGLKLANPPVSIPKGTADECKRQLADVIKKNGGDEDGAVGMWCAKGPNGGHFMGWKNVNGDIIFVNPQNGQDNCDKWFSYMSAGKLENNIDIARMDGVPENPKKINQIRKFIDYYLPFTLDILDQYNTIEDRKLTSAKSKIFMKKTEELISRVDEACLEQLNDLYEGGLINTNASIKVFEDMLKSDGLVDDDMQIKVDRK